MEVVLGNHHREGQLGFVFPSGSIPGLCNAGREACKGPVFEKLGSRFYLSCIFPFKMSFLLVTVPHIVSGKHRLKDLLFLLC